MNEIKTEEEVWKALGVDQPEDPAAFEVSTTVGFEGQTPNFDIDDENAPAKVDTYSARPVSKFDAPPTVVVDLSEPARLGSSMYTSTYKYGAKQARSIHFPTCNICLNELAKTPATRWGRIKLAVRRWVSRQKLLQAIFKVRLSDGKCIPELHNSGYDRRDPREYDVRGVR